jgi:hypothetical protein
MSMQSFDLFYSTHKNSSHNTNSLRRQGSLKPFATKLHSCVHTTTSKPQTKSCSWKRCSCWGIDVHAEFWFDTTHKNSSHDTNALRWQGSLKPLATKLHSCVYTTTSKPRTRSLSSSKHRFCGRIYVHPQFWFVRFKSETSSHNTKCDTLTAKCLTSSHQTSQLH